MKIDRRRAAFFVLCLSSAIATQAQNIPNPSSLRPREPLSEADLTVGAQKANPIGTEHAPVDGKDGMPHEGPFVETSAERDRKKAKESGEEPLVDKTKVNPTYKDLDHESLPQSEEGVMNDKTRLGPVEGTRGTEGGVSGKSKDGQTIEKKPDGPKEAPPLPHSEKEKIKSTESADIPIFEQDDKRILEKPTDLPDTPHSVSHPDDPSSPKAPINGDSTGKSKPSTSEEPEVIQPLHSLFLSFTMILFTEVGDKTFLVAALMAMRHDRLVVFSGAFSALIVMTILSAVLGHAFTTLIPESMTHFVAGLLFLVFGVRMLLDARGISPDEGVGEEMKEVEMELEEQEHQARKLGRRRSSVSPYVLESGRGGIRKSGRLPSPPESPSSSAASSRANSPSRQPAWRSALNGLQNLLSLLLSPAWVQTFVMTFLGEWGDRSQIATVAMSSGQDVWWVSAGALAGHSLCTGAAVLGGKALAGRVSLRTVTMGGAIAFLAFGVIYLVEAVW